MKTSSATGRCAATFILLGFGPALSAQSTPPLPASETKAPAAAEREASLEAYRLDTGDKLRVIVYDEPTLSGEFQVSAEGTLSLPLIGNVPAAGKTPIDVEREITARLADGYIRQPRVSAEVLTYRPFYILGEVRTPGKYPYANDLTVMNAIATAEGFTPRADKRKVFVRHAGAEKEEEHRLTPDLRVGPGDTIRIAERFF